MEDDETYDGDTASDDYGYNLDEFEADIQKIISDENEKGGASPKRACTSAPAMRMTPTVFDFSDLTRPDPQEPAKGEDHDNIRFMLIDVESISAKIRSDMDHPNADHSPFDDEYISPQMRDYMTGKDTVRYGNRKRQAPDPYITGPIIKIYGVCPDESSICVDVYGHYPTFRLQVVKGTASKQCMRRIGNYIEKSALSHGNTATQYNGNRPRNIVSSTMIKAFSAFPYMEHPSDFYEYRLSKAYSVRTLAEHFVKIPEMDDHESEGGVLGIIPHSCDDSLTQFMVNSGISGFGWVSTAKMGPPHDPKRSDTEACTCSRTGDVRHTSIRPISDHDEIAPLRVMGIDIECIKDEGMPTPDKNPVIIIGAIACRAVNGVVDQGNMKNIIFTWSPPDSGGVGEIPRSAEESIRVIHARDEAEMFTAFGSFLTSYDPDIYVGHNVIGFDIPYLVSRANALGVEGVMYMGRRRERSWSAPKEITKTRKNGDTRKSLRADTPGRIQLDTLPFIQNVKKESSYSLGALAQKYLGEGKDDVGYQMIGPLWHQSPETRARLCAYCLKDVKLSLGLAMHKEFEMVLSVVELSRCTRVRAAQLLRSGNQEKVKTLVLNEAKTPNFDPSNLPVFFPYETPRPRSKDDKFQGATVINPKRGARMKNQPIATGDFSSLYPSIMISHNSTHIGSFIRLP
jgi:DNA polymerase delta subunit 1